MSGNLSVKSKDIRFYVEKNIKTKTLTQVFNKTHAEFNTKPCNTTYPQALTIATSPGFSLDRANFSLEAGTVLWF